MTAYQWLVACMVVVVILSRYGARPHWSRWFWRGQEVKVPIRFMRSCGRYVLGSVQVMVRATGLMVQHFSCRSNAKQYCDSHEAV